MKSLVKEPVARIVAGKPICLQDTHVNDSFWLPRILVNRTRTLVIEFELLEKTGRLTAFNLNGKTHQFWDSDVAKWMEATAYSLAQYPDPALEQKLDQTIGRMSNAQTEDGYLNSFYQTRTLLKRWSNLRDMHELYCAGHLIEAAVAYYEQCGKRAFLDVMCRYTDMICATFGHADGQRRGVPGHPEIELALVRLYRATGEQRYLALAQYFINDRGVEPNIFVDEAVAREEANAAAFDLSNIQAHIPLKEQSEAVGHSVRACYLYTGMAGVAVETHDESLWAVCKRIWENLTRKRMYITGGIGSTQHKEQFTIDYDLPNENAYAETCAAISLVFFARQMLLIELNREYADIMERALYNGVLSGVSLDGEKFFYANRLAVYPALIASKTNGDRFAAFRQEWFDCACCPPNIARLLADIGEYVASISDDIIALHLYIAGSYDAVTCGHAVSLQIETDYPWDETVLVRVSSGTTTEFTLALRLPGWCRSPRIKVNGVDTDLSAITSSGYAYLRQQWADGDVIAMTLPMPVEQMEAHPSVRDDAGRIALQRGPLVYCLEECDNGADLSDVTISRSAPLCIERTDLLGGIVAITGTAFRRDLTHWSDMLYRPVRDTVVRKQFSFTAVPYCLWNNREEGEMRVWLQRE